MNNRERIEALRARVARLTELVESREDEVGHQLEGQLEAIEAIIEARARDTDEGETLDLAVDVLPGLEVIEAILYGRSLEEEAREAAEAEDTLPLREAAILSVDPDASARMAAALAGEGEDRAGSERERRTEAQTEIIITPPDPNHLWEPDVDPPPFNWEGPETHDQLPIEEPVEATSPLEAGPPFETPEPEAVAAVPRHLAYRALAAPLRLAEEGNLICVVPEEDHVPERIEDLSRALGWPVVAIGAPHQDVLASLAAAYGPVDGVDQDALLIAIVERETERRGLMGRMSRWFRNT